MAIEHDHSELLGWLDQQTEARRQIQDPSSDPFPTGALADRWLRERLSDPNNPEQQSKELRIAKICGMQDELAQLLHRVPVETHNPPVLKGSCKQYEWKPGIFVLEFDPQKVFFQAVEEAAKEIGGAIDPEINIIQFGDSDDIEEKRHSDAAGVNTTLSLTLGYPAQEGIVNERIYHFTSGGVAKVSYVESMRLDGMLSIRQKTEDVSLDDIRAVERLLPVLKRELVSQLRDA